MPIQIPEMGDFDREMTEHSHYDAGLVELYAHQSNWGRSRELQNFPLSVAHYREDTRRRLLHFLQGIPEFATQDFSDQRPFFHHFAHRLVAMSGSLHHANAYNEQLWLEQVRLSLHFVAQQKTMVARDEQDPIHQVWKKKTEQFDLGTGGIQYLTILKATDADAKIAWHFLGENSSAKMLIGSTKKLLQQVVPFLTEIDETYIERRLYDIRQDLLTLFSNKDHLSIFDKMKALEMVAEDWTEGIGVNSLDEIDAIQMEVYEEWGDTKEPFDVDRDPPDQVLSLAFEKLIGGEAPTSEQKAKAEKRQVLLEYLTMLEALKGEGTTPTLLAILKQYQRYHQALGLRFGDMVHLDLTVALLGAESPEKLREMLH